MTNERENNQLIIATKLSANNLEIIDSIVNQGKMILEKKSLKNMTFKMMDSSIR